MVDNFHKVCCHLQSSWLTTFKVVDDDFRKVDRWSTTFARWSTTFARWLTFKWLTTFKVVDTVQSRSIQVVDTVQGDEQLF